MEGQKKYHFLPFVKKVGYIYIYMSFANKIYRRKYLRM